DVVFRIMRLLWHGALKLGRLFLDLLLQLLELVELHLARHVGLHLGDVALHAAEQVTRRARDLGQALRPDHDQGHERDDDHLGKTEIEHGQGSAKPMEAAGARAAGVRRASGACAQEPILSDFSLTSASRVPASAMRCCVLSSAGVSTSFMPSLNPRTAPPRSEPMLRSFFVPITSSTITRTTSQCQMLKEPITLSSMLQHGRQHVRTTQYMDVEMIHLLPADPSRIDDRAEAVVQSLFARELRRDGHDLAHHRRMFG